MEIYDNDVDVLANQPGFNWHRENLRNYMNLSSNMPADLNTHYPKKSKEDENVARLFHTLAGVAMIDGAAQMVDGACEKTLYTGGFSAATNKNYYNTYDDFTIRSVNIEDYDIGSSVVIEP